MLKTILIISATSLIGAMLYPLTKGKPHECPFELCPYKGHTYFNGVINTGETSVDREQDETDTYYIDKLHFKYPSASYDELETMLFNNVQ
jgi:hypothetical protein